MIEICPCFCRGNTMESHIVMEQDSLSSISTFSNNKLNHTKMSGYSFCRNPILSIRTARSFKKMCLLTALLTFCIGIGVGVLIPLCLMPKTEGMGIYVTGMSIVNNSVNNYRKSLDITRTASEAPVMQRPNIMTTSSSLESPNPVFHSDNNADDISSRFPEFAQIEALIQETQSDNMGRTKLSKSQSSSLPAVQRPIPPNVQFLVQESRLLSLHPVQQPIPLSKVLQDPTPLRIDSDKVNSVEDADSSFVEGIYWSNNVEEMLPHGFREENLTAWRKLVLSSVVDKVEEGCGRMQNRLLTFKNEIQACCRYRQNSDQIQGEIFSFYLSRLLGLRNLTPSTLGLIQLSDARWTNVRQELNAAQWTEEKPVVFTQFIKNLSPAYIPAPLRDPKRSLHPVDVSLSAKTNSVDVKELAQWSDLIVFDYLTANLDRMVNNLYNLQWNPSMMEAPAHNLVKHSVTGLLVFLDNESGLLHGYRLLDKYEQYHRVMLDSLCVFRRSTVNAIRRLHLEKNVGHLLKEMFHNLDPIVVEYLPMMPDKSIRILERRIERVYNQIKKCESLYPL